MFTIQEIYKSKFQQVAPQKLVHLLGKTTKLVIANRYT